MDCLYVKERLPEYLEGLLPPEETMRVREHLDSCPVCSENLAGLERTIRVLGSLPDVEPPSWLPGKVMAKVRAEADRKQGLFRRLFYPLQIKLPAEALAAVLITVAVVYVVKTMRPEMEQPIRHEAPSVKQEAGDTKKGAPPHEGQARRAAGPGKETGGAGDAAGVPQGLKLVEETAPSQPPPAAKAEKTAPAEQAAVKPLAPSPGSVRTDETERFRLKAKEEVRAEGAVRKRVNAFILDGLDMRIGNTREDIIRNLGRPESEHVEKAQNIHEPGLTDERIRLSYDGLSITIYRSAKTGRELIAGISVTEGRYPLKLGIRLGSTASEIKAVFGDPASELDDTLTYVTEDATNFVHFRLRDKSVKRIDWDFYID